MKKLFLTTALAAGLIGSAASAQSVLERVLSTVNGNTNMTPVNGVFANIADNIATVVGGTQTVYTPSGDPGPTLTADQAQAAYQAARDTAATTAATGATVTYGDPDGAGNLGAVWYVGTYAPGDATYATQDAARQSVYDATANQFVSAATWLAANFTTSQVDLGPQAIANEINGSITNVLAGMTDPTAAVGGVVSAVDQVTVDLGDMSTTVLGAVNTGDITLGVNQDVTEALAGSSSAVSNAISQLGGSVDTSAIVLNVASNATSVLGDVNNSFAGLDGSIGNVATTVLGAVNTGTITSGVNSAVQGIQSGIVGTGAAAN